MDTHPSRHSNPLRARLHLFGVTAAMILALCATLTWPATAAPTTNAFTGSASVPEQVTFAPSASMSVGRSEHTAILLPNGKVLVVGGSDGALSLATAELYDPANGTWTTTGSMSVARRGLPTATLLPTGKVLVAGGSNDTTLASAELYDPANGTWSSTGSLSAGRYGHTATLLKNGKVLVAGGNNLASAELYDPASGTWSSAGSMATVRSWHTATLLNDGKVLVAGGTLASAELYDPTSGTWSSTGNMGGFRYSHTATLLPDGKVLVTGGYSGGPSPRDDLLYDPASGTWSSTGSMSTRGRHTTTLLPNGKVLAVAEGYPKAELYDPTNGTWSSAISIAAARSGNTATLLPNGKVLIAGGSGLSSTEIATLYPANTLTATLTLPAGWLNSTAINAQFVGTSSAAALDAGSLSNDATTWGAWVTAGSGVAASTTWDVGGEGANKPVSLRLRDVNGQIATIVTGMVNVDLTKPTSSMTALLPRSTANIALAWSGSDALSGVAGYDLQVRAGTGAWTDVLTNTLATSTTYNGVAGTTYAFRVRAKDVAGNIEDWPVDADTTTLAGGTSVSGSIYTATTWSASQSPYLVTSSVIVFPNTTLTIEPGVEVYFSANTGLTMRGNLLSIGTATKPITLTANVATPVKGSWQGVALATLQGGKATLAFTTIQYASSALSVECCGSGGPVTITDSTFRENNTALSGYAGWAIQVKRSLFENNISAVDSADKVIRDSVFRNNQYGLNATERVSVYNSVFTGNQVALYGGRGNVTYCTMTQNGTGVQAFFEGFTLTYNTIANNTVGVILGQYGTYTPPVQNNNIYGNATYNLKNTGPANKDVLNNWWGTVDTGLIETGLFDGKDDPRLGLLISQPIRTQAVDITPPLPTVGFSQATSSISEAGSTAVITVTVSDEHRFPIRVAYATSNGTATAGSDYTPISGTLTFPPDQLSHTISIPILNDTLDESNETVNLTLSTPISATLSTTSILALSIVDDDAPPTVQFSAAALTVDEGVGTAMITATLSSSSALTVTVPYATTTGTATAGSDYTATSGTLTFAPNQTSQTIRLPIVDDTLDEVDETVALALSTPTNATLGALATSTVTIRDNDAPPTVQFSTATLAVNESAGTAVFTATLSTVSSLPITVAYATSDGTANAPADYTPISGTLTFAPHQTSQTVTVAIVNDTLIEADETVVLALSTPTNASLGASAHTILTINDNDGPPTVRFSAATLTVDEGVGTAVFTATLSPASALPVTVAYATSDGTATAGSDYTATSGTLTFAPHQTSQTIRLPITNDTLDEVDETLSLTLSTPTNAVVGTATGTTLTILDNDGPTVDVHPLSTRVREGVSTAVLTVTLSAPSVQPITVAYASHDGTAAAGRDYTAISGTLTFAPGEQNKELSLPITDDAVLLEADETVQVSLVNPTGATLGATTASVTIVDNDVNTPPVDIPAPTDPSQPVTVPVNTPAGTVRLTFDNLGSSGVITTQVSVAPLTNAPSSFTLLGFNYEISTSEISFGKATLRLPYRDSDVAAAGIPEESLRLLHFDHGEWKDITTELDTTANIITGVTESFSPFVLGVQDTQQCAISINSGATYSGKLAVQIFSNTPNAAQILVSNDGGFTGAQWQPYRSAMPWTITDPGNRIVTLSTYVRLRDASGTLLCSGLSMSDDVIYDPLAPTVSATIIQSAQQAPLAAQAGGTISVKLTATDQPGGSGVADMQLSTHADFSGAVWQPFSATASIAAQPGDTVYVRVRDGVGNTSGVAPTTLAGSYSVFLPVIVR